MPEFKNPMDNNNPGRGFHPSRGGSTAEYEDPSAEAMKKAEMNAFLKTEKPPAPIPIEFVDGYRSALKTFHADYPRKTWDSVLATFRLPYRTVREIRRALDPTDNAAFGKGL